MAALNDSALGTVGFVMFGVCGFVSVIACIVANCVKMKFYLEAMGTIREWVEINLNDKYQNQNGIRWTISEERVVTGRGKRIITITYLHIVIQSVDMLELQ